MNDTERTSEVHPDDINQTMRYCGWSVFRASSALPEDRAGLATEVEDLLAELSAEDLVVRGFYDVSALRADADLMVWWHAPVVESIQQAYSRFRKTALGSHLTPVWSNVAVHRPSEFNKAHVPSFLAGKPVGDYICVYPFVRSYDWYVLPGEERSRMLREHGMAARDYPDVRANTMSAFALGDYEWILAFEADELHRIVDVMRELRGVDARLHVREETPFYTGPRRKLLDIIDDLP
ncbi:hydrogen peroxide-dependent heme synthase [Spelaeicoccus albus]|uniref:Coproheme decarboxylase n=1 Tax=Spelaeicoccus albus TaxID=1280376 RepID=A0A7Z0II33_9MICO|nr:hydrogen peroxide-dependent heme synthase [Spelaeicoccus albus]NYI68178.1 chlorite dismutase [Spelaeicoccus albus]